MRAALLGYSQAGKRTFFKLLTGRTVLPGADVEGGVDGQAFVRDPRVDAIARIAKPEKTKYAEITFVLCPDVSHESAAERIWIEPARKCDLLCMVVRAFSSESVYHPKGSVNAVRDQSDLDAEIMFADLELVEKRLDRISKEKRGGQTPQQAQEEKTLQRCKEALEANRRPSTLNLDAGEQASIRSLGLLGLKPIIWVHNVDEKDVREQGTDPFTVACKIEEEIAEISSVEEQKEYLKGLGLASSCLDRLSRAVYDSMGLMSFYTMGEDEVRAWTIKKGAFAPQAAGKIHTDFERGFIRVEIIKYDDLMALGSESACKANGKAHLKGKDYVIEDGDICHFRFNV
jgi:ribosome-binding ATPase